jgi:hypothetical protein
VSFAQENIISPMEDSPIPDMAGKDAADGAGTSPRSQGKAFGYVLQNPTPKAPEGIYFTK